MISAPTVNHTNELEGQQQIIYVYPVCGTIIKTRSLITNNIIYIYIWDFSKLHANIFSTMENGCGCHRTVEHLTLAATRLRAD